MHENQLPREVEEFTQGQTALQEAKKGQPTGDFAGVLLIPREGLALGSLSMTSHASHNAQPLR